METHYELGIDVGMPIIDCPPGSLPEQYLASPRAARSFLSLRRLAYAVTGNKIACISQCNVQVEAAKRSWFAKEGFHKETRIPYENVLFCRNPPDKALLCKKHGIKRQVDDRPNILQYSLGIVDEIYWFKPKPEEIAAYPDVAAQAILVQGWDELLPRLLESIGKVRR